MRRAARNPGKVPVTEVFATEATLAFSAVPLVVDGYAGKWFKSGDLGFVTSCDGEELGAWEAHDVISNRSTGRVGDSSDRGGRYRLRSWGSEPGGIGSDEHADGRGW
ncbi:hypothetical protein AWC27_26395 [Mycobacterium szulgai]|uniref:Uncharacterized protein n=1 Tax=Mycobacterium szulgai TaxID=1787 RepID=A0A1X2ENC3_MYCSZ|nr:hypothetical protein AWC27_26395 [Mycobacterium szulgai]